jgi:outer membrane protein OmpA-like peptidoglycan-associated protein
MAIANKFSKLSSSICAVSLLLLTACAQNPTSPDTASSPNAERGAKTDKAGIVSANGTNASKGKVVLDGKSPDYANMNPVSIVFDKLSIKLDDDDKQILAQISERAKKAPKLTITGFCDHNQVANPKAAALARADAVKAELIRLGVQSKEVRIKYQTNVPNKHMVEIQF